MPFSRSAIVVAHPDDEVLWLSSVLAKAERVVFAFGDRADSAAKTQARRKAVAALPPAGLVNLAIPESGAGFALDWTAPQCGRTGLMIDDPVARARYDANYDRLAEVLRPALAGITNVHTHNPWGEYGHAEHVQVHRAVAALQAELGFTLWFSNYIGPRSLVLARRLAAEPCWQMRRTCAPDRALARRLRDLYRRHGAWTWNRWHRWPPIETLYGRAADAADLKPLTGETMWDVSGLGPAFWRPSRLGL